MTAALTAFFARTFSTRAVAGLASGWAYVECAREERDAALAEVVARGHRSASLLHFVPARDLSWLSARILEAEGLPAADALDPMISGFLGAFRTVLGVHLRWLKSHLDLSIRSHIQGDSRPLLRSYGGSRSTLLPHPESEATLCCLRQLLPHVERSAEYEHLAYPIKLALGPVPALPDTPRPGSSAVFTVIYRVAFALTFLLLVSHRTAEVPIAGVGLFGCIAYWAHGRAKALKSRPSGRSGRTSGNTRSTIGRRDARPRRRGFLRWWPDYG